MWIRSNFFKYTTALLLLLLIILVAGKIGFFWAPFTKFIATIFLPILVAGLFYYMLRPVVRQLQRWKVPKMLSIIITFLAVIILFVIVSKYTGDIIVQQFTQMINDIPRIVDLAKNSTNNLLHNEWLGFFSSPDILQKITSYIEGITKNLTGVIFSFIGTITNIGTIIFLLPFILFYFLKDDHLFVKNILKIIPSKHDKNVAKIFADIDEALSSYISGQMTVALLIGILMYIGYLIIGMNYPLILAIFAMITCIIPFFGPWIGIIPAVLVALTVDPIMALKVWAVMMIVQQIDNNFISPQIMRKSLDIHPVTVILMIMGGSALFGLVGLLVAVPTYAAVKVTVRNLYQMYGTEYIDLD